MTHACRVDLVGARHQRPVHRHQRLPRVREISPSTTGFAAGTWSASIPGMTNPARTEDVPIGGEIIRLGQFLKSAGLLDSGGNVKDVIIDGHVAVNGEVDRRRGRQLQLGDSSASMDAGSASAREGTDAMEQPELLADDIRTFFRGVSWPRLRAGRPRDGHLPSIHTRFSTVPASGLTAVIARRPARRSCSGR